MKWPWWHTHKQMYTQIQKYTNTNIQLHKYSYSTKTVGSVGWTDRGGLLPRTRSPGKHLTLDFQIAAAFVNSWVKKFGSCWCERNENIHGVSNIWNCVLTFLLWVEKHNNLLLKRTKRRPRREPAGSRRALNTFFISGTAQSWHYSYNYTGKGKLSTELNEDVSINGLIATTQCYANI